MSCSGPTNDDVFPAAEMATSSRGLHPSVVPHDMQTDTFEAVKVNVYNLIGELAVRLRGPQVGALKLSAGSCLPPNVPMISAHQLYR